MRYVLLRQLVRLCIISCHVTGPAGTCHPTDTGGRTQRHGRDDCLFGGGKERGGGGVGVGKTGAVGGITVTR